MVGSPVAQGARLSIQSAGGTGTVSLAGAPYDFYTVETSTNLLQWSTLFTTNTPTGLATWIDLLSTNKMYFRAWSLP